MEDLQEEPLLTSGIYIILILLILHNPSWSGIFPSMKSDTVTDELREVWIVGHQRNFKTGQYMIYPNRLYQNSGITQHQKMVAHWNNQQQMDFLLEMIFRKKVDKPDIIISLHIWCPWTWCACVLMYTSPFGVSKSWGGGIPTSDRDRSGPRLRR